ARARTAVRPTKGRIAYLMRGRERPWQDGSEKRDVPEAKGSPRGARLPFQCCDLFAGQPSVGAPERGERFTIGALAQLLERAIPDLPDALARDAEQRADLLQRPLLTVIQTVVQIENLALALRQVLLEHAVEELTLCL